MTISKTYPTDSQTAEGETLPPDVQDSSIQSIDVTVFLSQVQNGGAMSHSCLLNDSKTRHYLFPHIHN